jgi:hypothetical protein
VFVLLEDDPGTFAGVLVLRCNEGGLLFGNVHDTAGTSLPCILHTPEEIIMIDTIQSIIDTVATALVSVFQAIVDYINGPAAE